MKNKLIAVSLAAILALTAAALGGCGSGKDAGGGKSGNNVTIAVPNDATNEARALNASRSQRLYKAQRRREHNGDGQSYRRLERNRI